MTDLNDTSFADMTQRVGKAGALFDDIRLDYPPQTAAFASLLEIQISAAERAPGRPCGGALLIAPFGSGKTVALEMLRDYVTKHAEPETTPVLLVETSTSGSVESLPASILAALKQPRPETGNDKSRWARAIAELQRQKVDLVIFDEFNRAHRRSTLSKPIVSSIREHIMDSGIAAVALVGSDEAAVVLKASPEMEQRLDDHIDLAPLDPLISEDLDDLMAFLGELDEVLAVPELLGDRSHFNVESTAKKLCEAGNGRIRAIMKIIRAAMLNAIRNGRTAIDDEDFFFAADLLAVRKGKVPFNPFAETSGKAA